MKFIAMLNRKFGPTFTAAVEEAIHKEFLGEMLPGSALLVPLKDGIYSKAIRYVILTCLGRSRDAMYFFPPACSLAAFSL